jgi:predicted acetyltransferase
MLHSGADDRFFAAARQASPTPSRTQTNGAGIIVCARMPPFNLSISKIGPDSEIVLRNLFEHYLQDMAEWFEVAAGYDTSLVWQQGYQAYLAKVDDSMAGFALVGSAAEWLGDIGAHDIHEFFVLRSFRRSGVGQRMAARVWDEQPGEWLVRVLEANAPAVGFWRTAISKYSRGLYHEEGRVVKERSWRFFRFGSSGK